MSIVEGQRCGDPLLFRAVFKLNACLFSIWGTWTLDVSVGRETGMTNIDDG